MTRYEGGRYHQDNRRLTDLNRAAERLLKALPADTRTWQQKLLGDPPPGRSALDRKRGGGR